MTGTRWLAVRKLESAAGTATTIRIGSRWRRFVNIRHSLETHRVLTLISVYEDILDCFPGLLVDQEGGAIVLVLRGEIWYGVRVVTSGRERRKPR